MLTKKGQFDVVRKSIYWMIAGVVIMTAVFGFALIISSYKGQVSAFPQELNAELISLRFTQSEQCFAYVDPITNRVYPGVIDLEKFTQQRIDDCYRTENVKGFKKFNFGLKLEGFSEIDDQGKSVLLMTNNFFNKNDFTLFKSVLVRNGDVITSERLVIYVQYKI